MPERRKVVIIGSGPAGLTAALYTARAQLQPLVLEGEPSSTSDQPGGQLMLTTDVENYPGFVDGIMGPELMGIMRAQAARFDAELRTAKASRIDVTPWPFEIWAGDPQADEPTVLADTLIIATGARSLMLGVPNEDRLMGYGVSTCATCDGFFFRGQEICVVGGGDSAMEEALFLTRFATKVTIINRSEKFRASKIMLERAMAHPKIEFITSTVVEEVLGVEEKDVKGLRLKNKVTGDVSTLPASAMFLGIGHEPNAKAFVGMMDLDEDGYILTKNNVFTTKNGEILPGVFACGDIQDRRYRQAITAAGSGCMAALEVEKYLEEHGR
jgi:thioredoxin reductase (NADPH)